LKFKIALLALISLLLSSCLTSIKNPIKSVFNVPDVTTEGLEITALDFSSLEAVLNLKVNNTNSISVEFPDINWALSLGSHPFVNDTVAKGEKLPPNAESIIRIPVRLNFKDVYARIPEFRKLNEVDYDITADLNFKLPIFGKSNNQVVTKGRLPIYKPLVIDLESIFLKSMEPEEVDFEIMSAIANDNSFEIVMERAEYSLKVNDILWANGNTRRQIAVAPAYVGEIPINISIKTASMVSDAYALVLSEKDVRYEFTGKLFLRTTSSFMNTIEVPFNLIGTKKIRL